MKIVNIHQAKTHLSRLIAEAVSGEPFIIAKSGKPLVRVEALPQDDENVARLGFMQGQIALPDDFDSLGVGDVEEMFEGMS